MPDDGLTDNIRRAIKQGGISSDPKETGSYGPTNPVLCHGMAPSMIVRPFNVDELQGLVRLANGSGLNLTVASSAGRHRKDGFAAKEENVLVDLSGWKKVPWINRRNRVCMIEPGVTYGELLSALEPHGMTIPTPLAPRSGKSVIAAAMDREPTIWPNRQWDIIDPVASTELIFGNGELFRTGAAGGPGTLEQQRAMGGAQKSPLGPSQTDFQRVVQGSQGTMGIITWITVRTELRPTVEEPYLAGADSLAELVPFIYAVQRQWLGEHSFVLDSTAAAMLMGQEDNEFETVRASLPRYLFLLNIAGFERMPKERVEYQRNDVISMAEKAKVGLAESLGQVKAESLLKRASRPCGEVDWRDRSKGSCLSIFFLTTLDRAPGLIQVFEKTAGEGGVDRDSIGVYVQPIVQSHGCHVELMCPFDPSSDEQVESMRRLERASVLELANAGAFFGRPYGTAGDIVFKQNELGYQVLRKMKGVFDPNRVMNRGKWGL